jgi:acyl-CoA reductase-like NAD-dependent aldehyde dehydrogenase
VGGGRPENAARGLFISPTLLDDVQPHHRVANEEIFGPVVSVLRWSDEAEAIALANSVPYGLTGSVFTNDIRRAHRVSRALETGFVWINGAGPHYLGLPYGGWKNSGVGSEEAIEELMSYSQNKSVTVML